jgi:hypothetical protein
MDASWVAAIASAASAFIVGIAAIAAVLQIRHIRNANDIATYLHLVDRLESANAKAPFAGIEEFRRQLESDRELRERMTQLQPVPEFHEIETLLRFLDSLSLLALTGSISERLIHMRYANEIVTLWDQVSEAVYLRRYGWSNFAANYEHLAMRAKAYISAGQIDHFYGRLLRDPRMADIKP